MQHIITTGVHVFYVEKRRLLVLRRVCGKDVGKPWGHTVLTPTTIATVCYLKEMQNLSVRHRKTPEGLAWYEALAPDSIIVNNVNYKQYMRFQSGVCTLNNGATDTHPW